MESALFSAVVFLLLAGAKSSPQNYTTKLKGADEYDPWKNAVDDPDEVARTFETAIRNSTTRRRLGRSVNPMDGCWMNSKKRKRLALCGLGFGQNAIGGLNGKFYTVTDDGDDALNPRRGSLRYAVIQVEPLWIVFARDMVITLKQELIMNSYKTVDGRDKLVKIDGGAGFTLQYVTNIIIVGLTIQNIVSTGDTSVRDSLIHFGYRTKADGDGISLFGASHVWIDHNSISNCADGLIDAIMGSTAITISNNQFKHHNEVMLLGHSDSYVQDKAMQVTIAFNHFGEGLIQRMPRHGYFHVVNNDYTHWEMYAIGGSAQPTINSQGNRYLAPPNDFAKEVTKRVYALESEWNRWNWRTEGDMLLNGAFFTASGTNSTESYTRASSTAANPASMVGLLTTRVGNTLCGKKVCS